MVPSPNPLEPTVERRRPRWALAVVLVILVVVTGMRMVLFSAPATARPAVDVVASTESTSTESASTPLTPEQKTAAGNELTAGKAVVLGLVEGITEFLPISSTGHLLVAERMLDTGQTDATKKAADTYTVAIQIGAILAVVVLYFGRLRSMFEGLIGRDPGGRRALIGVLIAFVPAAILGVLGKDFIENHLLYVGPVIAAWIVGAIVIFAFGDRFSATTPGSALEAITVRQAVIIGAAQCLAMWPGTSRSLVTILAALLVGMTLSAAVEFSFLLGLLTVSAATAYSLLGRGGELVDAYGWVNPLIGVVVAFVSALIAVRWMVTYLQRHSLAIFGWYRLAAAALTLGLLATSVI
jgi:undecaprenyl-diphosphatase